MPHQTDTPDPLQPKGSIELAPGRAIPAHLIIFKAARSSGPGGQNVNKRNTKVELRVRLDDLPLDPASIARLRRFAASRITEAAELVITASEHRSQLMNKEECLDRLRAMIVQALKAPKPRKATKPSKSSKARRVDAKTRRGAVKRLRQRRPDSD